MSAAAHTPGPWGVSKAIHVWIMAGPVHVATIPRATDGDWCEANANLIAAAPELLAKLEALVEACSGEPEEVFGAEIGGAVRAARAAISKARS